MEMKIMKITSGSENDKAMKYAKEYWRLGPGCCGTTKR